MTNLSSLMQTRNGVAVISLADFSSYIARKELSVVNAILRIPDDCMREGFYIVKDGELFLSSYGVLMLHMNIRHAKRIIRVMRRLNYHEEIVRKIMLEELQANMPPKIILTLLIFLLKYSVTKWIAVHLYKSICYFKKYDPTKYANHGKGGAL